MSPQLIQKMAQINSQVEFELTTASKVSGLLKEISSEHVLLDTVNGPVAILVDSIVSVQSLVNANAFESAPNAPNLDNQVDTFDPSNSKPNKIERLDSANNSPSEVKASGSSDTDTTLIDSISKQDGTPDTADTNTNLKDSDREQITTSDTADANIESTDPVPERIITSEVTDTETESIDSAPDQTAISDAVGTHKELGTSNLEKQASNNLEKQASKKLTEIEDRFSIQIQSATTTLGLAALDLTFPEKELNGWKNIQGVYHKWNQIKDYEDSQKTGELDSKSDGIPSIIADLEFLIISFPDSPALKRTLAYFYSLLGNWTEALRNYQAVAIQSEIADDWCDVAVCALVLNDEKLACYSLWKYFQEVSIIDEENELKIWYAYVGLLEKFKSLPAFRARCGRDDIKDDEIEILFDTAVYLLKKTGTAALATGIIQKRLIGESAECLLVEACQKLDSQPVKSYLQFFVEFNDLIALKKKTATKTPKPPKHINSVKHPISQSNPQKRKHQAHGRSGTEDLYRKAKQADQRGNLEEAENLYQDCLSQSIRSESVIKDLAAVLIRLERKSEAVDILEEYFPNAEKKEPFDNALINAYQAAGYYEKAIQLLNNTLSRTQNIREQTQIRRQIANSFVKLEDYVKAENQFRSILKLHPDNVNVQRNLARCLSQQGVYNDPEEILNEIQKISPDVNTAELLETIENAQSSDFELTDLSKFDKFILERCTFAGLPDGRVTDGGKYGGSKEDAKHDIRRLEGYAKEHQTIRPHERSRYLLSATKIYFELEDYNEKLYRYLCRSYASLGYVAVSKEKHLDTIREWFYETLRVYSVLQDQNYDEQDAVNALSRFLFSYLGRDRIPTSSPKQNDEDDPLEQQINHINQTIEVIISEHPNTGEVFDAIGYLLNNRYAERRILPCLYSKNDLRIAALAYLKNKDIDISDATKNEEDFVQAWHRLRDTNSKETLTILAGFEFLKNNFEFVTDQLEDCLRRLGEIRSKLFFVLDQERINNLQEIFKTALQICNEGGFEERERLYDILDENCQHLLSEIEDNPTKLSVEVLYRIVEVIQERVKFRYNDLLKSSKPNLKPELAKVSYPKDRKIEVQIAVANDEGRMPASSLRLEIQDDASLFTIDKIDNPTESLRGGGQTILIAILSLTDQAIQSKAFSLSVKVLYTIRGNREETTDTENFSIRLDSKDKFKDFKNPYAPLVNAQEVKDVNMFKGRKKEIGNIANVIRQSGSRSKCVLVYGQYRSGKSSLRYHLKKELEDYQELFVVDLGNNFGNLGLYKHESVTVRVSTLILDEITKTVQNDNRFNSLNINIPTREEIIKDSFPLQCFEEVLIELKGAMLKEAGIEQVVLLIDEFQYIYDMMLETENFNSEFMRTWKSFLQKDIFSAVLVGQQVMAKFKDRFPNEFASMEHQPVSYLTEMEARELIEEPILINGQGGESRYQEQAVERILKLTGRSAYYIVIICDQLVDLMKNDRTNWVTEADVQKVADKLIKEEFTSASFHNFTSAGDESGEAIREEDALKVLRFIAIKDQCSRNDINCDTRSPVDEILSDLVSRDVVGLKEGIYEIKVGLFKQWLIHQ